MKKLLLVVAIAFAVAHPALAAPFIVSDPLVSGVVQCGVFLDAAPKLTVPVTAVVTPAPGNICKFDVGGVGVGSHTITMTAITVNDPVWGSQESAKSSPLAFTRPAAPNAPSGLQLAP